MIQPTGAIYSVLILPVWSFQNLHRCFMTKNMTDQLVPRLIFNQLTICPGDMNWGKLLKIKRILVFSGTFTSLRKFFFTVYFHLNWFFTLFMKVNFIYQLTGILDAGLCDHTIDFVVFFNSTSQDHWETTQI